MGTAALRELIGTVVAGRYRVQDCLGIGTMGAVYRAEHIHMKKTVALKVLHPAHTRDPEVVERFQREAQAAANIEHPNVCQATDFGTFEDELYYLVMEFLDGRPLIDAIKAKESFGPLRILHIGIQMLSALEKAHELGVVHRDLKPENVLLVTHDGDPDFVKITDFGVAQVRLFKDAVKLTQAGVVYGSPLYMSPQQAAGKSVDHRADLYSVGIMLYELAVGQVPFYAKTLPIVLNMHMTDPPPPFAQVNPSHGTPAELEAVVMRLLEKDPDHRYQSAREVREALEQIERAVRGVRDSMSSSTPEGDGRQRRIITSMLIFLAAVIVLWGVFLVARVASNPDAANAAALRPDAGRIDAAAAPGNVEPGRRSFLSRAAVRGALSKVDKEPDASIAELTKLRDAEPGNAHASYVLGRTLVELGRYDEGFTAIAATIALDSDYGSDAELVDLVFSKLEQRGDEPASHAEKVVVAHPNVGTDARLASLAEHHVSRKIRKRALKILQDSGRFGSLQPWNQLTIKLRHAVGCEENRELILEISKLGDPRAVAALRRFTTLPKTGCGDDKSEDCYDCLRADLHEIITKLESAALAP